MALLLALLILFLCFLIGYFANALYGYKFDLAACWAGVAALTAGGVLAILKFTADSVWNSEQGKKPYGHDNPPPSEGR